MNKPDSLCGTLSKTGTTQKALMTLIFFLLLIFLPFSIYARTRSPANLSPAAQQKIQGTDGGLNPNPQKVVDLANLLTTEEREKLAALAETFINRHNIDMVLCTTADAEGKSAMEFADDYFDYNGYGIGPDFSGVLLLIDMDNREVYISTTGRAIAEISDAEVEKILDVMISHAPDNPYKAFSDGIRAVNRMLGAAAFMLPEPNTLLLFLMFGLIAGTIAVVAVVVSYRAGRVKDNYPFNTNAHLTLTRQLDVFIGKTVSKQKIERSSSSGGGGSSHTSSSGRSHGGGGRRF